MLRIALLMSLLLPATLTAQQPDQRKTAPALAVWTRDSTKNEMDDSRQYNIHGHAKTATDWLTVRIGCAPDGTGELVALLASRLFDGSGGSPGRASGRYRIDGGAAQPLEYYVSEGGRFLFVASLTTEWLNTIATGGVLKIEAPLYQAGNVVFTLDLKGFKQNLEWFRSHSHCARS